MVPCRSSFVVNLAVHTLPMTINATRYRLCRLHSGFQRLLCMQCLSVQTSSLLIHGQIRLPNRLSFSTSASLLDEERTVEEQYSRKSPLEHVLLRPGMYVGPNERLPPEAYWVVEPSFPPPEPMHLELTNSTSHTLLLDKKNMQSKHGLRMVRREYGIVPALVKIFDEILVNASDNRLRHPKSSTRIDVIIDPGEEHIREPCIRVANDGKGIPVSMHKHEHMYVPQMVFGVLLTGSNFDDSEKRITGGRHGYGAKLTNIFSKSFTVDVIDSKRKLCYRQTWSNNMREVSEPMVQEIQKTTTTANKINTDSVAVTFVPDLPRLTGDPNATCISEGEFGIMCRRVLDVAGCAAGKLHVTLNGVDVSLQSFDEYIQLYRTNHLNTSDELSDKTTTAQSSNPVLFKKLHSRLTLGVGLSQSGSFESVSFVNGISTHRGGTHVNVLVQQIVKKIADKASKTDAELGKTLSPNFIRRHLFVCVDAHIENPTFDSQMKEYLTSSPDKFGCSYDLDKAFLDKIVKEQAKGGVGIIEEVIRFAKGRQQAGLLKEVGGGKQSKRQLLAIPKLEDAHQAGSESSSHLCTLILTEGDSAKALAVAGLEVVGREHFGVFPLRGKFMNVRDASVSKLAANNEVKALCAILGLAFEKQYLTLRDRQKLRYGRVLLMTDQDTDGSHIKGLVINFFRHFWPELLQPPLNETHKQIDERSPPFLASFVTPLLKVSKKGSKKEVLAFYSIAEFKAWRNSMDPEEAGKWAIKYYKGLGTSTTAEAKEYFSAFDENLRPFRWKSDLDGERLDMVFDKKRAVDRRGWILETYDEHAQPSVDHERENSISYHAFVDQELIHFSHADNIRSIPSVIDGLKPSQRKVLYACFKRNLKSEIKVAQLTGYCAEHTAYHHGETSLQSTIIGMAQNFVGSNNVNLLVPSGQFGTRLSGGDDAASPRYIFTSLSPITRRLFPEVDDILLAYRVDDGQQIEPEFYCPAIPMLLVNGTHGIGTGWSSVVPPHNPIDVLNYIRAKLDNAAELPIIRPYAKGFKGSIKLKEDGTGYVTLGCIKVIDDRTVVIDELPLGCWTSTYKEKLVKMQQKGIITDFVENHTTSDVSFTVFLRPFTLRRLVQSGLESSFDLSSYISTNNMHAFDTKGKMRKFHSAEAIAEAFFPVRLELYNDRKSVLEAEMKYHATTLRNKANFISAVTAGNVDLMSGRQSRAATSTRLAELGFAKKSELHAIRNDNAPYKRNTQTQSFPDQVEEVQEITIDSEFDYLLNMPLSSLTSEKISELQEQAQKVEEDFRRIQSTKAADLWREDLDKIEPLL